MKFLGAAILLVLVAVAVPNPFLAVQCAKENRTMNEMRAMAAKIEEHAPLSSLPRVDGWGAPYEISIHGNDYSIRSYGSDGRRDANVLHGPHTARWRDIVLANGSFVSYPVGI